jgi:hypothetical protein
MYLLHASHQLGKSAIETLEIKPEAIFLNPSPEEKMGLCSHRYPAIWSCQPHQSVHMPVGTISLLVKNINKVEALFVTNFLLSRQLTTAPMVDLDRLRPCVCPTPFTM